ncbi:hypothetical protein, partial [Carnobacterium maltaromaticum]|uniref:hypothetical protein n=1 Tax=Carnobacterium maltaromaticum TaxID=2751 RepID=UPI00110518FD
STLFYWKNSYVSIFCTKKGVDDLTHQHHKLYSLYFLFPVFAIKKAGVRIKNDWNCGILLVSKLK